MRSYTWINKRNICVKLTSYVVNLLLGRLAFIWSFRLYLMVSVYGPAGYYLMFRGSDFPCIDTAERQGDLQYSDGSAHNLCKSLFFCNNTIH